MKHGNGMIEYRVWPDGTVQEASEEPYTHMSDDYATVWAVDEEDALVRANGGKL